jgi:hypothetical protein
MDIINEDALIRDNFCLLFDWDILNFSTFQLARSQILTDKCVKSHLDILLFWPETSLNVIQLIIV